MELSYASTAIWLLKFVLQIYPWLGELFTSVDHRNTSIVLLIVNRSQSFFLARMAADTIKLSENLRPIGYNFHFKLDVMA